MEQGMHLHSVLDVRCAAFDVFRLENPLLRIIREKIETAGSQPFAWFMEQALYHPEHGYYSTDRAAIGRGGDYFTNVSVGPLFGQLLAFQFFEIWKRLNKPENFSIVEQGAHYGDFARDVLESAQREFPELSSAIHYVIVEPFPKLQQRQSKTLEEFGAQVRWRNSLDELEPFVGIHFSNELLDAMPINLRNRRIGVDRDQFVFVDAPMDNVPNRSQLDWVASFADKLNRGFIVAVDYGFTAAEFRETVQVRARHRLLGSPFEEIGNADISAHVNWTEIGNVAEQSGLHLAGFTDQHHFLTGIISACPETITAEQSKRALQTLLHPEMLGRSFQVLALAKNVDLSTPLSGFKFARDARVELGL
jgi:SAM-dependent MidA family methyltransferase